MKKSFRIALVILTILISTLVWAQSLRQTKTDTIVPNIAGGTSVQVSSDLNVTGDISSLGDIKIPSTTQSSIIFVGPLKEMTEDAVNFIYDDSSDRVGLGTIIPQSRLSVTGTDQSSAKVDVKMYNDVAGDFPSVFLRRARNNEAVPAEAQAGDTAGEFQIQAHNDSAFIDGASVRGVVTETFSSATTGGVKMELSVNPDGALLQEVALTLEENKDATFIGGIAAPQIDITSVLEASKPYPSMTEAQRDAIVSLAVGKIVYNTTTGSLNVYNGVIWEELGTTGPVNASHPVWAISTVYSTGDILFNATTFKLYRANVGHTSSAISVETDVILGVVDELSTGGTIPWLTATQYLIGDLVHRSNKIYIALTDHTSGVFSTDITNSDIIEVSDDMNRLSSATDNALVRFDGTGGGDVQNSLVTVDDVGVVSGSTQLNVDNVRVDANTVSATDVNGDLHLAGNGTGKVIIDSDLQVDGTTTTVNSTTLDVAAAKVNTNVGGNQASANSNDSGIEINITDAQNAGLAYDSTLASSFKIGETNDYREVVTVSDAQSILNKNYGNSAAIDANLALDIVSTSKAGRPCPIMTEAQRDLLTAVNGSCVFNSDVDKLNIYNGTIWTTVGGGAGLSTGLYTGAVLSIGATTGTFNISTGSGVVVDSITSFPTIDITDVTISARTNEVVTNILTHPVTYISITSADAIVQRTAFPDPEEKRDEIFLGVIVHSDNVVVNLVNNLPDVALDIGAQTHDVMEALGFFNVDGNRISANGANLSFDKTAGIVFKQGSNFVTNPKNPHHLSLIAKVASTFRYRNQDSSEGPDITVIDPTTYDLAGTTTAIAGSNNQSTIQRVYLFPSNVIRVQRGQEIFATLSAAVDILSKETFAIEPNIDENGLLLASIAVRKGATDLSDNADAQIFSASRFGELGSVGSSAVGTLQQAYDNSLQPQITIGANGVQFRDNATPIGASLFAVQDNAGTTNYLDVLASGITLGPLLNVDDLRLNGNTISSTGVNSDIILTPNGTGVIQALKPHELAQLTTPTTPASGNNRFYSKSTDHLYNLKDTGSEVRLSEGSHELDTYYKLPFIDVLAADFTTGNDATFLNGGTFAGTLTDETVAPISGTTSIDYDGFGAISVDDYIVSPIINIDPKQSEGGKFTFIDLSYTYDGADGEIAFILYDVTNSVVLTDALDTFENVGTNVPFLTSVFIPDGVTQIRWGIHVKAMATNPSKLRIDDVQFSTRPSNTKNLTIRETASYYGVTASGAGGALTYSTALTVPEGALITVDTASGYTKYIFNRAASIVASTSFSSTGNSTLRITLKDSSNVVRLEKIEHSDTVGLTSNSMTIDVNVGDYIISTSSSGGIINDIDNNFSVTAWADSEHVVTPAKSNMTDWIAFTPSIDGGGTLTNTEGWYRRVGDTMDIKVKFDTGTVTATTAALLIPNSHTVDTGIVTTDGTIGVGEGHRLSGGSGSLSGDYFYSFLKNTVPSKVFLTSTHASGVYETRAANGIFSSSSAHSFHITGIPISGWSSDATFLAAVPVQQIAYIKDVKSSTTNGGGCTANTVQIRDLNSLTGDTGFVSLSSNQFTLSAGKYKINASAPAANSNAHQIFMYDVTNTAYLGGDFDGTSMYTNNITIVNRSEISAELVITTATTYEIRHWTAGTQANSGLGQYADRDASNPQSGEVYTEVEITKLK